MPPPNPRPAASDEDSNGDEHKTSEEMKDRDPQAGANQRDSRQGEVKGEEQNGDQEQQTETPQPVGFFDKRLRHVRDEAVTKWCITTAVLMAFIIAVLSLYWGVFTKVDQNVGTLAIYVVDFDGQVAPYDRVQPVFGPTITRMAETALQERVHLGYQVHPPTKFNFDPVQVRQAVYDWDAWAAIIINANATALLRSAVHNGNASYDPMGACQLIYIDSRDDTNWYDFISPLIRPFMTEATAMVGTQWAQQVLQNASTNPALTRSALQAPQALSPAIGFSDFFSFSFYLPIHFKYLKPEGHPPLKFWQLILWRWCSTIVAYLFLSLAYSFVSLAWFINFNSKNPITSETLPTIVSYGNPNAYGYGTFPVYWMVNFFVGEPVPNSKTTLTSYSPVLQGMIALGLACENVAMIVGQPWSALWLIFWVITNVSTSFYDIGIEPGFYQWGYAWPLHSVVERSRQILFDLHSRIGIDFGILAAWFACYFMRWKSKNHIHEYYK